MTDVIEAGIRVCKDYLGLSGCQARSERAQLHRMTGCLVAFGVLERERQARGLSCNFARIVAVSFALYLA
jgi:hypothetical protein